MHAQVGFTCTTKNTFRRKISAGQIKLKSARRRPNQAAPDVQDYADRVPARKLCTEWFNYIHIRRIQDLSARACMAMMRLGDEVSHKRFGTGTVVAITKLRDYHIHFNHGAEVQSKKLLYKSVACGLTAHLFLIF